MSSEDPRSLGRYELLGRLGEGGQGTVFLGRDRAGTRVAVKLLRGHLSQNEESRSRFLHEVAAAKRVARFCTAQVLDADLAGAQPYIVSEYIPGPSLASVVESDGPRGGTALERIAVNTATALAGIHQAGIVHRDFKAANVLLGPDGPVVIDFGIAKAIDAASRGLTLPGYTVGTPGYMAPEQFTGEPVGPAADIFAWGVTMAFAATGRLPFGNDQIPAVMYRILNDPPQLDGVTGPLRSLVAACLEKDPARRPVAMAIVDRLLRPEDGSGVWTPARQPSPAAAQRPAGPAAPRASAAPEDAATPVQTRPRKPRSGDSGPSPAGSRSMRRAPLMGAAAIVLLAGGALAAKAFAFTNAPAAKQHAVAAGATSAVASPAAPAVSPSKHRKKHRAGKRSGHSAASHSPVPPVSSASPTTVTSPPPRSPAPTPSPTPTPTPTPNPYTPTEVCGSGYTVIDSHALAGGTIYLLYDSGNGDNCVATMRSAVSRKIWMVAKLRVQGGSSAKDSGYYTYYAGPVSLAAPQTCVEWGGTIKGSSWMSGWSHCG